MKKLLFLIALTALCVVSCGNGGDDGKNDGDGPEQNDSDTQDEVIEPICLKPSGTALTFTDISEELGVHELNALGTQITVADIDGDKWPDVYTSTGAKTRQNEQEPSNVYKLLKNEKGKKFKDVTFSSGLFANKNGENGLASTYVIFADVNNDGFKDAVNVVYVDDDTYSSESFMEDFTRIYLNNGDGTFKLDTRTSFTLDIFEAIAGVTVLDYDRDGNLDLFVGRQYIKYGDLRSCEQDTLMRGLGDGKFENVTAGSGLETTKADEASLASGKYNKPTWGVTACDIDGDGFSDIMTSSYGRAYNMLYRNKGDGTFDDLSLSSNFAHDDNEDYSDDQFFACYCADAANKDSDYCANATKPLISCSGVSGWEPGFSDQPYRLGGNSAVTLCGDFDNDGDTDLFQIELAHWHIGGASDKTQLLMNDGFPETPLRRVPEAESGITRSRSGDWNDGDLGGFTADLDNDGNLEIYLLSSDYPGTKSMLFKKQADGKYKDIAADSKSQVRRAHGGAFVDIDRDGDYDMIVGTSFMRWAASDNDGKYKPEKQWIKVLRNDTGQDSNKVIIDLAGKGANRDAVGAKIVVRAGGKQFVREVLGGYGLNGFQNDSLQIIGLGDICEVESIEITWPDKDGTVTKYENVYANYVLEIDQEKGLKHHKIDEYFGKTE